MYGKLYTLDSFKCQIVGWYMLCFVRNGSAIVDIVSPLVNPGGVLCLVKRINTSW